IQELPGLVNLVGLGPVMRENADHPTSSSLPRQRQYSPASHAKTSVALQVRLEIGVVTHLIVDLQAITLTVGDDDLIGLRIENHRRREAEAPELLQILHAPVRLHHIGV